MKVFYLLLLNILIVDHSAAISRDVTEIVKSSLQSITASEAVLHSINEQNELSTPVYSWCGMAIERLESYLRLFGKYSQGKARMQQRILIQVLEEGLAKFSSIQVQNLEDNIRAMGEVKLKLQTTMDTIKDVEDFDELEDVLLNEVKIPVEKLIGKLREYREKF